MGGAGGVLADGGGPGAGGTGGEMGEGGAPVDGGAAAGAGGSKGKGGIPADLVFQRDPGGCACSVPLRGAAGGRPLGLALLLGGASALRRRARRMTRSASR